MMKENKARDIPGNAKPKPPAKAKTASEVKLSRKVPKNGDKFESWVSKSKSDVTERNLARDRSKGGMTGPVGKSDIYGSPEAFFASEIDGYEIGPDNKVAKVELWGETTRSGNNKKFSLEKAYSIAAQKYNSKYGGSSDSPKGKKKRTDSLSLVRIPRRLYNRQP
jgi:hypothetical protein